MTDATLRLSHGRDANSCGHPRRRFIRSAAAPERAIVRFRINRHATGKQADTLSKLDMPGCGCYIPGQLRSVWSEGPGGVLDVRSLAPRSLFGPSLNVSPCKVRVPNIEVFHGAAVFDEAEIAALRHIEQWLTNTGQSGIIFANVRLPPQLDLVVFTGRTTIVVEVKAWRGKVEGKINGKWTRTLGGAPPQEFGNAYDQVMKGRYALYNAFRQRLGKPDSYPHGIVVFTNGLDTGSTVERECSDFFVSVCRMENFEDALQDARGQVWAFDDVRALAASLNLEREPPVQPRAAATVLQHEQSPSVAAYRTTATHTVQHAPSVRTAKRGKARLLAGIGILGILVAVGIGAAHRFGKTSGTADGQPARAAVTPAPANAAPLTAAEQGKHRHRAARHHRPQSASPHPEPAPPSGAFRPEPAAREERDMNALAPPNACPPGIDRLGCPHVVVDPARSAS